MATINPQLKRELKSQLHALKPIVIIGDNGLTDNVLAEIERALNDHELIKIRLSEAATSEKRDQIAAQICETTRATLIQTIGWIIAIYRKSTK
jgi:RNA-binding protein